MAPTIIMKNGQIFGAIGCPGGSTIIGAVRVCSICRLLCWLICCAFLRDEMFARLPGVKCDARTDGAQSAAAGNYAGECSDRGTSKHTNTPDMGLMHRCSPEQVAVDLPRVVSRNTGSVSMEQAMCYQWPAACTGRTKT